MRKLLFLLWFCSLTTEMPINTKSPGESSEAAQQTMNPQQWPQPHKQPETAHHTRPKRNMRPPVRLQDYMVTASKMESSNYDTGKSRDSEMEGGHFETGDAVISKNLDLGSDLETGNPKMTPSNSEVEGGCIETDVTKTSSDPEMESEVGDPTSSKDSAMEREVGDPMTSKDSGMEREIGDPQPPSYSEMETEAGDPMTSKDSEMEITYLDTGNPMTSGNVDRCKKQQLAGKWVCDVCKKTFAYKSLLKMHQVIHTGERPFPCKHCGERFTQSASQKRHENICLTAAKEFECEFCCKYFRRKESLKEHQDNAEKCQECWKKVCRGAMDDHMRKLHGGYKCEECGEPFATQYYLTEHLASGEHHKDQEEGGSQKMSKPALSVFKCLKCGQTFSSCRNLGRHKSTHTGNEAEPCKKCNKVIHYHRNMKQHLKLCKRPLTAAQTLEEKVPEQT